MSSYIYPCSASLVADQGPLSCRLVYGFLYVHYSLAFVSAPRPTVNRSLNISEIERWNLTVPLLVWLFGSVAGESRALSTPSWHSAVSGAQIYTDAPRPRGRQSINPGSLFRFRMIAWVNVWYWWYGGLSYTRKPTYPFTTAILSEVVKGLENLPSRPITLQLVKLQKPVRIIYGDTVKDKTRDAIFTVLCDAIWREIQMQKYTRDSVDWICNQ